MGLLLGFCRACKFREDSIGPKLNKIQHGHISILSQVLFLQNHTLYENTMAKKE